MTKHKHNAIILDMSQKEKFPEAIQGHSELIHNKDKALAMAEAERPFRETASQIHEKIADLPDDFSPIRAIKRFHSKGRIKDQERSAERAASSAAETFDRIKVSKESLRSQSYLAGAIKRAKQYDHEPGIMTAVAELEAYRDASPAEALELFAKPKKGLSALVEGISQSVAGKHKFTEKFTYEKSGMIHGWNTLQSTLETDDYAAKKGVEHVTADEVAAIYDVLGISAEPAALRGMTSLGNSKTNTKEYYLGPDATDVTDWGRDYESFGTRLRVTTHGPADLGEVYIPAYMTFDLAANPEQ